MPIVSDLQDIVNSRPELGWQQAGKDEWLGRCPQPNHGRGRGDRNRSLKLFRNANSGKPQVHCFAGCPTAELRAYFGLPNAGDAPTRPAPAPAMRTRIRTLLSYKHFSIFSVVNGQTLK